MDKADLSKVFKLSGKTLKTCPVKGASLVAAIELARDFVNSQREYSRVEFPLDGVYYVVAKLKDL